MDLKALQRRAAACTADLDDVAFRYTVFASQSGDLARYIYHDPKLNPKDRLHGSPADEALSYGHAFLWLSSLASARGVELDGAVEAALKAVESREYARHHNDSDEVKGVTAFLGEAEGPAFVFVGSNIELPVVPKGAVLVVRHGGPELISLFDNVAGIVADEGGLYSHLAVLCRERKIPCVVGTGNATRLISHGQRIRLSASDIIGKVELV
ncbi:hypothetical protein AUJ14_03045 [Candidatus Micrarchaeota archaeon CG1_02_55_22]|nr:MAG: hypothetical protein AUJ14_03045 [Candidatus Micrarchaeota archaeon CG1_02_55_22]